LYLEGWRYEILGLTMVKYHVVFLMSLLVRIVNSVFVAPHMQEPEAVSTLAAVKEIGNELKGKKPGHCAVRSGNGAVGRRAHHAPIRHPRRLVEVRHFS
jgi:hypothetical protein